MQAAHCNPVRGQFHGFEIVTMSCFNSSGKVTKLSSCLHRGRYFESLRQDLVASPDPSLRAVSVTTGVLGSFSTETARAGTKGQLDHISWHPPSEAAEALLTAGARRWREVHTPWYHHHRARNHFHLDAIEGSGNNVSHVKFFGAESLF